MNLLRKKLNELQTDWDETVKRLQEPGLCDTETVVLKNRLWELDQSMKNVEAEIRAEREINKGRASQDAPKTRQENADVPTSP